MSAGGSAIPKKRELLPPLPELPNGALQLPPAKAGPVPGRTGEGDGGLGGEPVAPAGRASGIDAGKPRSLVKAAVFLAAAIVLGILLKVLFGA